MSTLLSWFNAYSTASTFSVRFLGSIQCNNSPARKQGACHGNGSILVSAMICSKQEVAESNGPGEPQ